MKVRTGGPPKTQRGLLASASEGTPFVAANSGLSADSLSLVALRRLGVVMVEELAKAAQGHGLSAVPAACEALEGAFGWLPQGRWLHVEGRRYDREQRNPLH